jgi:hypothetical protein
MEINLHFKIRKRFHRLITTTRMVIFKSILKKEMATVLVMIQKKLSLMKQKWGKFLDRANIIISETSMISKELVSVLEENLKIHSLEIKTYKYNNVAIRTRTIFNDFRFQWIRKI